LVSAAVRLEVRHIFTREVAMLVEERLESQDVFGFLRPEQLDVLSNAAEVMKYKAGDTVYYHGQKADHMYVVLEGAVLLRLPGKAGISLPIDLATKGIIFGACRCFDIETYATTAECMQDSKVMKIEVAALRRLMDQDLLMGYIMQRRISQVYFERYLETVRKLQGIVLSLPIDAER
jgi:CRP-like cAMP-binding protein